VSQDHVEKQSADVLFRLPCASTSLCRSILLSTSKLPSHTRSLLCLIIIPTSLQHYYQVFLPNKPPALYKALPVTSVELSAVSEGDIKASLPGAEQLKDWQLGAMLPFMLSREVVGEESFHTYASRIASGEIAKGMQEAGKQLMRDLEHLEEVFQKNSEDLDKVHPGTWYTVMHPKKTANSILI
jgi:hypothetical protein